MAAVALVAYLVSVGTAIYTLLPHTLETEFRGGAVLRVSDDAGATDDETYRAVVSWLENIRDQNATTLDRLGRWYVASAIALGLEVMLWTIALTT